MEGIKREETACFTGHRHIPEFQIPKIKNSLKREVVRLIKKGYKNFICGGAYGFDTLAALTVLELKNTYPEIKLILALPCPDRCRFWKQEDIKQQEEIMEKADIIRYMMPVYFNWVMMVRNRFMVDNSNVCIAYLRKNTGGTAYTVNYSQNGEYGRRIDLIKI